MDVKKKTYRIRWNRFIPFLLIILLILILLVMLVKYTTSRPGDGTSGNSGQNQDQTQNQGDLSSTGANSATGEASVPEPLTAENCFENSAFMGNSCIEGFRNYGIIDNVVYLSKVGLSVDGAYTQARAGSEIPIMDELWNDQFTRIFIMFGENELGWKSGEAFAEAYGKLIDDIKIRQPYTKIYVQSILPVSAAASAKNQYNTNNKRINEYNERIQAMAIEKGVIYIDVASVFKNEAGCLPDEASSDGVHLNKTYMQKWADFLVNYLIEEQTGNATGTSDTAPQNNG